MKYKTQYKGFTLVELVIAVGVLLILSSMLIINFRPEDSKKKARDNVRLTNIAEIERVINEYMLDTGSYPGDANVLYKSTNVNWVSSPLSKYITTLPIDPINKDKYFYYYKHDATSYEVTASLEYFNELMVNDSGNQPNIYEVGNNLTLISD